MLCCAGMPGASGTATTAPGSRIVPYSPTEKPDERDEAPGKDRTKTRLMHISAMPEYANKSVEELRSEDYTVRTLLHIQCNLIWSVTLHAVPIK